MTDVTDELKLRDWYQILNDDLIRIQKYGGKVSVIQNETGVLISLFDVLLSEGEIVPTFLFGNPVIRSEE